MNNQSGVRRAIFLMFFLFGIGSQSPAIAVPPQTVNYQGVLSSAGAPVNGTASVIFRLYNVASGGTALWSETQMLNVVGGLFSAPLGSVTTFASAGLQFDVPYFLGITVGMDAEMTPRPALTSAPYALRAGVAEGLTSLRIVANAGNASLIGGAAVNGIATATSAVIGGGGGSGLAGAPTPDNGVALSANVISGAANGAVIAGGSGNQIIRNNTAQPVFAAIGGGENNIVYAYIGVIAGGRSNVVGSMGFTNYGGSIGGGFGNNVFNNYGSIAGGTGNQAGFYGTVPGGANNLALGNYSLAAGRGASTASDALATTRHDGTFLWADGNANGASQQDFFSTASDQFAVRARGGVSFRVASTTNAGAGAGCSLPAGGAPSWSCSSDRNLKEAFSAISPRAILDKVAALPLSTWRFIGTERRHIGPMAQDFRAAFGFGVDDKTITTSDVSGVALAAIQGLYQLLQERDGEIARLKSTETELAALKRELGEIKSALGIGNR